VTHYFVTGATGVVGSSLVPVLLRSPDARLTLLVRAANESELQARLGRLFDFWKLAADDERRVRVTAVAGDTTLPQFGLPTPTYRELAASCTHIVHAAGLVRMNLPLEEARRSAVGAARQVVAFARACGDLRKLDLVSTVGVGGRMAQAVPERWLTEARSFHNTYEQAKAEAEDFLRDEVARSPLPLTVHRPSMVVGDTRDGRIIGFQVFYHLCEFLSGRRTFGLYPDFGDTRLDIIGCDLVAEAIAAASGDDRTIGRILHLCSGPEEAIRLGDLKLVVRRVFSERGIDVPVDRTLPLSWYLRLLRLGAVVAPPRLRGPLSTLPIFLDYLADSHAFDDTNFLASLAARRVTRPPPSSYVGRLLDYYLANRPRQSADTA